MATLLQSMVFSSFTSHCSNAPRSVPGSLIHSSLSSSFNGQHLRLQQLTISRKKTLIQTIPSLPTSVKMMVKPSIQFIQGTDEQTIPDVKLTRSKDGSNGAAIFTFSEPSVFDSSSVVGDITGLYMIDEEGTLQSTSVNARFVNGKPAGIEAKYVMRSPKEWDRFMRFMERYANANGLSFVKK